MRRVFVLCFVLFISANVFCVDPYVNTRPISLQAGLNEALNVRVERIPSQSENYLQGMPFNIEDSQVQYVEGSQAPGRLIAYWSLIANTDFNLTFTLEPLRHISSPGEVNDNPPLSYVLTFEYIISYGLSGNKIDSQFSLDMSDPPSVRGENVTVLDDVPISKDADGTTTFKINLTEGLGDGGTISDFIGSLDGGIYFIFTPESTAALENDPDGEVYKPGSYLATVTINMEVAQ